MPRPVSFKTKDGVIIHGVYCPGNAEKKGVTTRSGVVLFHMMPATKESWAPFTPQLVSQGFSVLAIDLRGHGQSVETDSGNQLDYSLFENEQHMAKINDVEAAVEWLSKQAEMGSENIGLIGASIGANLSISYAGTHPEIPVVVALSPGLDYHGVTTADKVKAMRPEQKLYLVASDEDERSFLTNQKLAKIKLDAVLKEFHNAGHGTKIFEAHPEFMIELAGWVIDSVPEKQIG